MKREPSLWLARHAPVLAEKGVCYGASDFLADQASTLLAAKALAVTVPLDWAVHVSPLQRCQQMAKDLQALRPDLRFKQDARLRELDFGAWEGKPWASIERAEFDEWLADFANARPGSSSGGGESVAAMMARVDQAWKEWCTSKEGCLWLTHAGVMRAAILLSRGVHLPVTAADWPTAEMPYGEVLVLQATAHS